jgi:hypothetical protein
MKYAFVALLLIFGTVGASAQKDIFWADGGISLARLIPGASATYNYQLFRFLGIGGGAQVYDFHATYYNFQPVPALYLETRWTIRSRKKNQYFLFSQAGLNVYKRNTQSWVDGNTAYIVKDDNGAYRGLGFGYFRPQTNRGWGHYVTLKFITTAYNTNAFDRVSGNQSVHVLSYGTIVISYGYKF